MLRILAASSLIFSAFLPPWAGAAAGTPQAPTEAEIVQKGKACTALVEVAEGRGGYGSAFCIDGRGFYVSNAHVVPSTDSPLSLILNPGEKQQKKVAAKVLRRSDETDLVLLKIDTDAKLPSLTLGSDEGLIETNEVTAFGFPFGKELAFTPGEYPSISVNKGRITALRKKQGALNRIQIDAILNPGNSGGPMLDKGGSVIGVVVSGIVGAGAVNFAIPVSYVRKFLEAPAISFQVPDLSAANLSEPMEFAVTLSPSPLAKATYTVELTIKDGRGPPRKFDMKASDDVYRVKAAPLPGAKSSGWRLSAVFGDGQVSGIVEDFEFTVGKETVRLKDAVSIKPGATPSVALLDGRTLTGALGKLEAVPLRVGGQKLTVNLMSAVEVNVNAEGNGGSFTFTIVVRNGAKEVATTEEIVDLGDGASSGGTGASLEAIIGGKFNRPPKSSSKQTYLNVQSTAGDYIGGGQSYAYGAKEMTVTASQGHVSVRAGGWNLDIGPGKGKLLKVGEFNDAKRYPFNDDQPGLNFSGNGRGSNQLSGKFVVWELVIEGTKVTRLAIDFVQHSEHRKNAPLAGMLRFNSTFR